MIGFWITVMMSQSHVRRIGIGNSNCEPGRVPHEPKFFGQKPYAFSFWLFQVLGLTPSDDFVDIYPGSGAVTRAWQAYGRQYPLFPIDAPATVDATEAP